jgi:hypothetical protein
MSALVGVYVISFFYFYVSTQKRVAALCRQLLRLSLTAGEYKLSVTASVV